MHTFKYCFRFNTCVMLWKVMVSVCVSCDSRPFPQQTRHCSLKKSTGVTAESNDGSVQVNQHEQLEDP